MRCISPHPNYSLQVFEADEQIVVDQRGAAHQLVLKKPVIANFDRGGLTEWEIEAALESFNFSGLPEGVNPLTRVSVFDTEAMAEALEWDAEFHNKVEERLRKLQARFVSEFQIVEKPGATRPWPTYDEDDADFILNMQLRLGVNPEVVRLYELENKNRQEIIDAMLQQEDPSGFARAQEEAGELVVQA